MILEHFAIQYLISAVLSVTRCKTEVKTKAKGFKTTQGERITEWDVLVYVQGICARRTPWNRFKSIFQPPSSCIHYHITVCTPLYYNSCVTASPRRTITELIKPKDQVAAGPIEVMCCTIIGIALSSGGPQITNVVTKTKERKHSILKSIPINLISLNKISTVCFPPTWRMYIQNLQLNSILIAAVSWLKHVVSESIVTKYYPGKHFNCTNSRPLYTSSDSKFAGEIKVLFHCTVHSLRFQLQQVTQADQRLPATLTTKNWFSKTYLFSKSTINTHEFF